MKLGRLGFLVILVVTLLAWGNQTLAGASNGEPSLAQANLSKTFYSVGVQDGWVLESLENSNKGGTANGSLTTFRLGDDRTRKQYRGILSFKTGGSLGLPSNAIITSAKLVLRKQGITGGGNPFTTFQGLQIDIKKGYFGTSAGLQTADFQATANPAKQAVYKPASVLSSYTITLSSSYYPYINKTTTSTGLTQLRLRFKLDDNNNALDNFITFYSGNYATQAYRPKLVINYELDTTAPAAIADLTAQPGADNGSVDLSWTAPGDDGLVGTAASYLVRYSMSEILDEAGWTVATVVNTGIPTPQLAGTAQSMTVSGLTPGETYYFAVRAQDEAPVPNLGGISNNASLTLEEYPAPILDLSAATGDAIGEVDLKWTAVGAHGSSGTASYYMVRYSPAIIDTEAKWYAATIVNPASLPAPQAAGASEAFTVTGLTGGSQYYFAVRATYDDGLHSHTSGLSTSPSAHAKGAGATLPCIIESDTTIGPWSTPYWANCGVWVPAGVILTIEPGTTIRFHPGIGLTVAGTLIALGTADAPIVFTSDATPAEYWSGINLTGTQSDSALDHVIVEYGGNGWRADVQVISGAARITNSVLRDSYGYGFYGSGVQDITFSNNTLTNNGNHNSYKDAVYLNLASGTVRSLANNAGSGNGRNAIALSGSLGADLLLPVDNSLPYVLAENGLAIDDGATLTLPAGSVLKCNPGLVSLSVNGTLRAEGTSEQPVYFTSIKDDTVGVDADGVAVSPARGDWDGIRVGTTGSASFDYATVRYAGNAASAGLVVSGNGSVIFQNGTVSESATNGFSLVQGSLSDRTARLTISNSTVSGNQGTGISSAVQAGYLGQLLLSVSDSHIRDNGAGISVGGPNQSSITGNEIANNSGVGVAIGAGSSAELSNNTLSGNGGEAATIHYYGAIGVAITDNTGEGNGLNGISISGHIGQDTSLTPNAGLPYILQPLTVDSGATLSLGPGVVIKGQPNSILTVNGSLEALGTALQPVYFTSLKDDAVGGDTNNDGATSSPQKGDWGGIDLGWTSIDSHLSHVMFRFAGGRSCWLGEFGPHCGIGDFHTDNQPSMRVVVDNSTISDNAGDAYFSANGSPSISNSVFSDNESWAINLEATAYRATTPLIIDNTFLRNAGAIHINTYTGNGTVAGNNGSGNASNTIWISSVAGETTLAPNSGLPYRAGMAVQLGDTLTIPAGVVLKGGGLSVWGSLFVEGTSTDPVVFTSLYDDSVGGDTTNDGSETSPAPGDWAGIAIEYPGYVELEHAFVDYAGQWYDMRAAMYNRGGTLSIAHSMISRSGGVGIYTSRRYYDYDLGDWQLSDGRLSISDSTVSGNLTDGILVGDGTQVMELPSITNNNIYDNGGYGLWSSNTTNPIPAENNWWGDPTGPDPYGWGNGINYRTWTCVNPPTNLCEDKGAYVDVVPWLVTALPTPQAAR